MSVKKALSTALELKNVKAEDGKETLFRIVDTESEKAKAIKGLYFVVTKEDYKRWSYRYKHPQTKKSKNAGLGSYPDVKLKEAKYLAQEYTELLKEGIDPIEFKKADKRAKKQSMEERSHTLELMIDRWLDDKLSSGAISETYHRKQKQRLHSALKEYMHIPVKEIEPQHIREALKAKVDKGYIEVAHRVYSMLNEMFLYLKEWEFVEHNIIGDINKKALLPKHKRENFPHISDLEQFRELIISIQGYKGDISTMLALRALPLLFVRPSNLTQMLWSEIDFKKKIWSIPAQKMKIKREFVIPLPHQVIELLKEVQLYNGGKRYVFASTIGDRPMSENTLNYSLKRLGYGSLQTAHGFRHSFSTIANELKSDISKDTGLSDLKELIDFSLAHQTKGVEGVYNKSSRLQDRAILYQWWADFLDEMKI